jgi:hypothetical protein
MLLPILDTVVQFELAALKIPTAALTGALLFQQPEMDHRLLKQIVLKSVIWSETTSHPA